MKKIVPIILPLIGIIAGGGAGFMFKPAPADQDTHAAADAHQDEHESAPEAKNDHHTDDGHGGETGFVKLSNQFVVPDILDGSVVAMVVLSLSLETQGDLQEAIFAKEPKLRDAFLQVMFDHANSGGFRGEFTGNRKMDALRTALHETATMIIGPEITSVLVQDIVRQDLS